MNQALKSRHGTAREAGCKGAQKPPRLSDDDWRRVHDERRIFPNRWEQQREANRIQCTTTGISWFGSGGKANFFVQICKLIFDLVLCFGFAYLGNLSVFFCVKPGRDIWKKTHKGKEHRGKR